MRLARQSGRLGEVVAFYRDRLGLPEVARFEDHAGYDGVMLDIPGTGAPPGVLSRDEAPWLRRAPRQVAL